MLETEKLESQIQKSDYKVLIVDDVCTTGSTLAELAAVMRKSGAISVYCAASCKTPLTKPNKAD